MREELKNFVNECWSNHHQDLEGITRKLEDLSLSSLSEEEATAIVNLVIHVFGGHQSQERQPRVRRHVHQHQHKERDKDVPVKRVCVVKCV